MLFNTDSMQCGWMNSIAMLDRTLYNSIGVYKEVVKE
jgi:hypothetical protein